MYFFRIVPGLRFFGKCVTVLACTLIFTAVLHAQCQPVPVAGSSRPAQVSSSGQPQFYEEPQFTVAGVTDASNLGGHASAGMGRVDESLTNETVSLSKQNTQGVPISPKGNTGASLSDLEKAANERPDDSRAAMALTFAYADAGRAKDAEAKIRSLLERKDLSREDQAALHHLLGQIEERSHKPLDAVREYQRAAELNASETNLFDWGSELLLHRAAEPASQVFANGNRLFPNSTRMMIAFGVSLYTRGAYDGALQCLGQAADANPDDPGPYLFLGKMLNSETVRSQILLERLERFARSHPENAVANYNYAVALWKRSKSAQDASAPDRVESLLKKAIQLDPKFATAYLQLGIVYADRGDYARAIAAYKKAIDANPELEDAHYRLAAAYRKTGETTKASDELKLHQRLAKKAAEKSAQEHSEIQQFVISLRDKSSPAQSQQN